MIEQFDDGAEATATAARGRQLMEQERATPGIDDLLRRIEAEKRSFDQTVWPPASSAAIERLRAHARESLWTELPPGYIAFLRAYDGFAFNGYAVYGATEHKAPFLDGFAEANVRLADPTGNYVFYGNTDNALFAQDRERGLWVRLYNPSLDVLEEFPNFESMLACVLRDAYEE